MNSKTILLQYGGEAIDTLPDEIRARVEADPALRQAMQAQHDVARLLALKTHEVADPAMEGRLLHRVRLRIEAGDLPATESAGLFPAWARVAAAALLVAGFSWISVQELLREGEASAPPEVMASATAEPLSPALQFRHVDPFTTVPTGPMLAMDPELSKEIQLKLRDAIEANPFGVSNNVPEDNLIPVLNPLGP